jgi:excisionase family DNA binding protein
MTHQDPPLREQLFSPKSAAKYLGVVENTLSVWRSTGRYDLPYIKVGRLVKYRLSDLQAFLARNTKGETHE